MNQVPSFTLVPEPFTVIEGRKAELHAKAKGKPVPEITWVRSGETIVDNERTLVQAFENEDDLEVESTLNLSNIVPDDERQKYRIEAANKVGSVSQEISFSGKTNYGFI